MLFLVLLVFEFFEGAACLLPQEGLGGVGVFAGSEGEWGMDEYILLVKRLLVSYDWDDNLIGD